ncbi:MAG: DinB family protein [Chloroflexi bacterium]|nr:DinB family protein [Chloroflexota bacterium]
MTPEAIRKIYDYSYWAFERVWNCICKLTDEQFTQELGYSMGSIRNHVIHMVSSHHRWVNRLKGEQVLPHLNFEDYSSLTSVKAKWDEAKAEFLDFIYSLDQAQLDEVVRYEIHSRGVVSSSQRWEVLLHLANHSTDHRSQILAMLHQQFGIQTIEQDMIFFLWGEGVNKG